MKTMLAFRTGLALSLLLSIQVLPVINQAPARTDPRVVLRETVELAAVAKLKIQLDKDTFHSEEVIRVNIATLIESPEKIHFPQRRRYEATILNAKGIPIKLQTINMTHPLTRRPKYLTLENGYLVDVDSIIIGCTSRYLTAEKEKQKRAEDSENPRDLFEVGIFPLAANKCFDAKPGSGFSMQLALFNDEINEGSDGRKTAIGTIRSNKVYFSVAD